jgi:predicted DNA-binding antitoxin AbrB/MazE fold protein
LAIGSSGVKGWHFFSACYNIHMESIHATYSEGVFRPLVPISLPEGSEVELRIIAPNETVSASQSSQPQGTIEERLTQIAGQLPRQEWDSLPADLSDQLDHYLYGTPQE